MKLEEISIPELEALVHTTLSGKRCRHVLNVREEAVKLARRFGADLRRCEIAALLHDITKEMDKGKQLQMLEASGIMSDMVVLKSPPLYHAYTGAIDAEKTLGMTGETVLNAIRDHTVARAGMTEEEKIVYLADAISKDRNYAGVEDFRKLAFEDLNGCMKAMLKHTITYLVKDECLLPDTTIQAYNEYCGL